MGSLGILGAGAGEFATDSGSVIIDFATKVPSLALFIGQFLATGTALNGTASVLGDATELPEI